MNTSKGDRVNDGMKRETVSSTIRRMCSASRSSLIYCITTYTRHWVWYTRTISSFWLSRTRHWESRLNGYRRESRLNRHRSEQGLNRQRRESSLNRCTYESRPNRKLHPSHVATVEVRMFIVKTVDKNWTHASAMLVIPFLRRGTRCHLVRVATSAATAHVVIVLCRRVAVCLFCAAVTVTGDVCLQDNIHATQIPVTTAIICINSLLHYQNSGVFYQSRSALEQVQSSTSSTSWHLGTRRPTNNSWITIRRNSNSCRSGSTHVWSSHHGRHSFHSLLIETLLSTSIWLKHLALHWLKMDSLCWLITDHCANEVWRWSYVLHSHSHPHSPVSIIRTKTFLDDH